jgi:3-oxoacyl-[acyl-carrier protein] reductase
MERIALVTGASRGIGAATARELSRRGWAVCLNYRTGATKAEALAEQLRAQGRPAICIQADVADEAAVSAMVRQAEKTLGPISLAVNNAGISRQALFQDVGQEDWNRLLAVNLTGARNVVKAVLPGMLAGKQGAIVNVASVWGLRGASCEALYACSKAALVGLTRSLAAELGPSGIRVNCVAPGVIATDMLSELSAETLDDLAQRTPLGRLGAPEDVARAVAFLASEDAAFITGQVLTVDGGFSV